MKTDSVTLSWYPPESSGGLPLRNYIVEYRDVRRSSWMKAASVPCTITMFTCLNLDRNSEFVFRIIATNDEGESAALESKKFISPENEFSK